MDSFNVEGLWVCFSSKVPQSTDYLQVSILEDCSKIWREHLVFDMNKMAEYEFVHKSP